MIEQGEKRSARRDYMLFGAGVVVSTVVARYPQTLRPAKTEMANPRSSEPAAYTIGYPRCFVPPRPRIARVKRMPNSQPDRQR
jgi:hypothetical protein